MPPKNISNFGRMYTKNIVTSLVDGCFMGNGISNPLIMKAGDSTNAIDNLANTITCTTTFAKDGTTPESTMIITEQGGGGGGLRIRGVFAPTTITPADKNNVVTKKYVDEATPGFIIIKTPVMDFVENDLSQLNGTASPAVYTASILGIGGLSTLVFRLDYTTALYSNWVVDPASAAAGTSISGTVALSIDQTNIRIALDSVLIKGTGGVSSSFYDSDGVYTLTSMGAGAGGNVLTWTRRNDLDSDATINDIYPIPAGSFVKVNTGSNSIHAGKGFYLKEIVATSSDIRKWSLFSNSSSYTYKAPIEEKAADGSYWVSSANASDVNAFIVAGNAASDGLSTFSDTLGKVGNSFSVTGANIILKAVGTMDITNSAANQNVILDTPSFVLSCDSNTTITSNSATGLIQSYANTMQFGKELPPSVGSSTQLASYTQTFAINNAGNVVTKTGDIGTADRVGNGILFDSVTQPAGGTDNIDKFYVAPYVNASNVGSLEVFRFDVAGNAVLMAEFKP